MIALLSPIAADGISYNFGYVFAGCNLAAGLLVWFFLYESKTLSLENVDLMYGQPELKPWTSHKWVPPGYITRKQRDESHFRHLSVSGPAGTTGGLTHREKRNSGSGSGSNEESTMHERV